MGDKKNRPGKPERISGFKPIAATTGNQASSLDLASAYSTLIKAFLRARVSGTEAKDDQKEAKYGQEI